MWGVVVTISGLIALVAHPRHGPARAQGRRGRACNDHLRIHKEAKETRKARGTILALCLAGPGRRRRRPWPCSRPGGLGARRASPLFAAFALAGRPQGKTITSQAVLPATVQPPTQDVITRALGALGIARSPRPSPRASSRATSRPRSARTAPGGGSRCDLPYGVTATQIIERREQLASGLRRPLGAVWPEVVSHEHAGPPGMLGRPGRHLQGEARAVAVAADRRR